MAVSIDDERTYLCDPATLLATFKDPAFQRARSAHLGTLAPVCERNGDTLVLTETRNTGFGPHVYVTRLTTRWTGMEARWELERQQGPGDASAKGTLRIEPARAGSRLILEGVLEIRVPIVSGLIERLARRGLVEVRAREARFVSDWLSKSPADRPGFR